MPMYASRISQFGWKSHKLKKTEVEMGWSMSMVDACASELFECGTKQGEVSRDDGECKHDAKTCGPRLPLVSTEVHRCGDAWCPLSYGNAMPTLSNFWLRRNLCYVFQVFTWGNDTCFDWNPFSEGRSIEWRQLTASRAFTKCSAQIDLFQ